jgi:hypothetical protein
LSRGNRRHVRTFRPAAFLVVALAISFGHNARAQGYHGSARIRDFEVLLTVQSDGSLDVVEQIAFHFTGSWDDIVRDVSLRQTNAQGRTVKLKLSRVSVTDLGGHPLPVKQERKDWDRMRALRISIPNTVNADRTIIIQYRVENALRFFLSRSKEGEIDELYRNVVGSTWDMLIDSVHAHVVLPDGVAPTRAAAFLNQWTPADAKIEVVGSEVDISHASKISRMSGLEIDVRWPAGSISPRATEEGERLAGLVRRSPMLLPFVVFFLAFVKWMKRGLNPEEGSIQVEFEPVDGASAAELGALVDSSVDVRDVTSTLVDLAVRGYIRIEETAQSKIMGLGDHAEYIIHIVRKHAEWIGLKPHEIRVLGAVSSASPHDPFNVLVSQLRSTFPSALPRIRDGVFDSLVARGYYRERPDELRRKWIGLALILASLGYGLAKLGEAMMWVTFAPDAVLTAGVASGIIVLAFGLIMSTRTLAGVRARASALGFREFLSRVESERYKKMITSPEMFDRLLPYAIAFGLEKKWTSTFASTFETIARHQPEWYTSDAGTFNPFGLSHSMRGPSGTAPRGTFWKSIAWHVGWGR